MKVTMIQAPQMVTLSNYLTTVAIPPLGLAYITAALEQADHEVQFIDGVGEDLTRFSPRGDYFLRGLTHEDVVSRVASDTRLICIGCMFTPQWPSIRGLLQMLKDAFPTVPIVVGGEHASALPEYILETSTADYVVIGEGEETIVELVGTLEKGQSPDLLAGTACRLDGKPHRNLPRKRIKAVDDLPWPSWEQIPVEAYISYNQPHGAALGRSFPMLATRGCPYRCSYCSSPQMWTTKWVSRNVENVVDEMQHYMEVYNANDFHFEDLTAIVRKDWIIDFCKEIVNRGLGDKLTWQLPSGTRSEAIDTEVMTWMSRAGAKTLSYAPESGSDRMLKLIRKKINVDHMMSAARDAVKCKMSLQANFVLGHHEETFRDILKTYKLLLRCAWVGFTEVHLACFYPLPNTEDWEKMKAKGKIPEYSDDLFRTIFQGADPLRPVSWNEKFSDRQMQIFILFGYSLFYGTSWILRPWRLVKMIYHLATGQATNKTERILKESFRKVRYLQQPAL